MHPTLRGPVTVMTTVLLGAFVVACGDDAPDVTAAFETPDDGAHVAGGLDLLMTADGITIEPAGEVDPGAGHFHVIADHGCADPGEAIARDGDHVHFGTGGSTGTIYLTPGRHSLCLQVGDGAHTALDATDTIEVEVGIETRDQWCAVVEEVDSLFAGLDATEEDFTVKQAGYANVARLLDQLDAAIALVDPVAVPGVTQLLEWSKVVTDTVATSASEEHAIDTLYGDDSAFAGLEIDPAGPAWILEQCGVEVD